MTGLTFWLAFAEAVLLICHEIESAYWQEWKLFRLPGGVSGFVLLHLPLLAALLLGLVDLARGGAAGRIVALFSSLGGLFAFFAHRHFRRRGDPGFGLPLSRFLLVSILLVSLALLPVAALDLIRAISR